MEALSKKIDTGAFKTDVDLLFDKLSIEQKLSLFNLNIDLMNLESRSEIEETTTKLWYNLNKEMKQILIINIKRNSA